MLRYTFICALSLDLTFNYFYKCRLTEAQKHSIVHPGSKDRHLGLCSVSSLEIAEFSHSTPNQMVFQSLIKDVVMFNQQVYSSPKGDTAIGKIDEILGKVDRYYFTVNPVPGVASNSLTKGTKIYLDKAFVLPIFIFTNPQKPTGPKRMGGGIGKKPGFGGNRPQGNNFGNRPQGGRPQGNNFGNRPQGGRPQGNNFGARPNGNFNNPRQ